MKVLFLDIETAPIVAHIWSLWKEDNVGLNQVVSDWHLLSWSAKWLGDPPEKIMYQDQRLARVIEDDKKLLRGVWRLLNEADVVIAHNGAHFDVKKLNARFIANGFQPPSPYRVIDTLQVAKRKFAFTSNRLEYLSKKLCVAHRKKQHKRFPGHELWRACLDRNQEAWKEMEDYNKADVLALEELYRQLAPWDKACDVRSSFMPSEGCSCGSKDLKKNGVRADAGGRYQRWRCNDCGAEYRERKNLIEKSTRKKGLVRI